MPERTENPSVVQHRPTTDHSPSQSKTYTAGTARR
jgi:hypothetical protein